MNCAGTQTPHHVVVVGGGTAGWLSALLFQQDAQRRKLNRRITLIESSKVPTIGVGEGTTSIFGGVLRSLGIEETEFLAKTDATIKYGIRHRDWRTLGHFYDGPIDDPYLLADRVPNAGSWLDTYCVAAGRPVADPHVFSALMAKDKAPVAQLKGRDVAVSQFQHAYHFDQAKVGTFLRSKSQGIETIDALVQGADQDPDTGNITALHLDTGQKLDVDFCVDCTGFRRGLITGLMGAEWISYGDVLPVNRAMPFWIDLPENGPLPSYTHAWAQKSGWMWQIPTQGRIGCGYVYSDRHISPDQAQAEIENALGHPIEPRNDIKIDAGRINEVWRGNVLALGLASSFLEPLEATSIHGTLVSLLLFLNRHSTDGKSPRPSDRNRYNQAIARQVDDFRDFINLHYVSERRDSPFWCDVARDYIQPQTRDKVEMWSQNMPSAGDFTNDLDGLPHVEELLHYPVLDGLGLLNQQVAKAEMARNPKLRKFARETVDHLKKQARIVASKATSHRDWLASIAEQQDRQ
jgi:tryptophan halogenase